MGSWSPSPASTSQPPPGACPHFSLPLLLIPSGLPSSHRSGLIAGFALAAFMQFDFSPDAATEGVQLAFGVTIALTVGTRSLLL